MPASRSVPRPPHPSSPNSRGTSAASRAPGRASWKVERGRPSIGRGRFARSWPRRSLGATRQNPQNQGLTRRMAQTRVLTPPTTLSPHWDANPWPGANHSSDRSTERRVHNTSWRLSGDGGAVPDARIVTPGSVPGPARYGLPPAKVTSGVIPEFWRSFAELAPERQAAARSAFRKFHQNPAHPSLPLDRSMGCTGKVKTVMTASRQMEVFQLAKKALREHPTGGILTL